MPMQMVHQYEDSEYDHMRLPVEDRYSTPVGSNKYSQHHYIQGGHSGHLNHPSIPHNNNFQINDIYNHNYKSFNPYSHIHNQHNSPSYNPNNQQQQSQIYSRNYSGSNNQILHQQQQHQMSGPYSANQQNPS
jgi:hypothetical protein